MTGHVELARGMGNGNRQAAHLCIQKNLYPLATDTGQHKKPVSSKLEMSLSIDTPSQTTPLATYTGSIIIFPLYRSTSHGYIICPYLSLPMWNCQYAKSIQGLCALQCGTMRSQQIYCQMVVDEKKDGVKKALHNVMGWLT